MSEVLPSPAQGNNTNGGNAGAVVLALIGWLVLWFSLAFVAAVIVGVVYGVQHKHPPQPVLYVTMAATSAATLACATWYRVGWDPERLGLVPIRRRWLLVLLSIATLLQLPVVVWLVRAFSSARHARQFPYAVAALTGDAWARVLLIIMTIAVVPVVEEVLFRGWLWADLRRHWSAASVMLFTGLVFVLVHVVEDYRKAYTVLLFTMILTLARQFCGSVKATIWLHFLNNATIAAVLLYVRSPAPHG